jgi:hypothetical protein
MYFADLTAADRQIIEAGSATVKPQEPIALMRTCHAATRKRGTANSAADYVFHICECTIDDIR